MPKSHQIQNLKRKKWRDMAYYVHRVWESGGTRPPCPPLNCAHGYNGATVCILIHWQPSSPIPKSSSIHSCTYNQIRARYFHCRISIAETQTCLQALNLFSACSTRNELFALSVEMCALCKQWSRKKIISNFPYQKLQTSQRTNITTLASV